MTNTNPVLEKIKENIPQKESLVFSLADQSVDLLKKYNKNDFESIMGTFSLLITDQFDSVTRIKERNSSRLPTESNLNIIIEFFKMLLKAINKNKKSFPLENKKSFQQIIKDLMDYIDAKKKNELGRMSNKGNKVKEKFPRFLKDEFGITDVEKSCNAILEENQKQKILLDGLIHPENISEKIRKEKINIGELKEIPKKFQVFIDDNERIISVIVDSIKKEKGLIKEFESLVTYFFSKTDIANRVLELAKNKH